MTSAELHSAQDNGRRLSDLLTHAWAVPGVFLAALAWFALLAWVRPLTNPDEGRYVGVALDMLTRGDWIVPRLDGLPFFHKPPLFYWLSAASMGSFGVSELAGRMPSLLGASLAVASIFALTRRWADPVTAGVSALVLACMPYFYVGAQFANLDMLVAGVMSATIATAAYATLRKEAGETWRWLLTLTYALAGLGLLAKGLIGLVLPGAVYVLWTLVRGKARASLSLLFFWPGWLAFAAVALPWLAAMQLRYDSFFDYFIVTQHFRRFSGSGFNNAHPFWFFVPVILALTLPWPLWLIAGGRKLMRRASWTDLDTLMLVWLLVIVVFFSIPSSKLIGYVLAALPPLAVLVARCALALARDSHRGKRWLQWTAGFAATLCAAAGIGLAVQQRALNESVIQSVAGSVSASDRVVMLDEYYYQVPFYWKRSSDSYIAGDWRESVAAARDNWRKEIWDAGRFESARAARLLISIDEAARMSRCGGVTWFIGTTQWAEQPWLLGHKPFAIRGDVAIWRIEPASAMGAAGVPECSVPAKPPAAAS
jgi:4-amino-4-deoxy-L-arabinose transferase-like glycosyltransferase